MCNALWECLKCPAKVVCCCCKCACNMIMGCICTVIVILVVIGLIVYFTVFHNKGKSSPEAATESVKALMSVVTPATFRDLFKKTQ